MTGAALVSAAAIVAATPAFAPGNMSVAMPSPHALSTAKYELTDLQTLLGLTAADYQDAYFFGHGGGVTPDNPYFPFDPSAYPLYSAPQIPGVVYLALDALVNGNGPDQSLWDVNKPLNYLYELGTSAAIQVVLQQTIGSLNPAISAAITTLFNIPATINALIVSAASTLPKIDLGPITIGGGYLAGIFYYGQTPDYVPADPTATPPVSAEASRLPRPESRGCSTTSRSASLMLYPALPCRSPPRRRRRRSPRSMRR